MYKFVIAFCIFFSLSANAQQPFWTQTNGPSGRGGEQFGFNSKGDIFCIGQYLLRSTDDGASWKDITPNPYFGTEFGWAISAQDYLFILTDSSLYRSEDNGDTWNIALKKVSGGWVAASNTGPIYVGALPNLWRSTDEGTTWANITSHMPYAWRGYNIGITSFGELTLINRLDTIFYFSTNEGNSWSQKYTLPFRMMTYALQSTSNGYLYSGYAQRSTATDVDNGFAIRSKDNGLTWDSLIRGNNLIICSNDVLFATVSPDSLMSSTDYGNSWMKIILPDATEVNDYDYYNNPADQKGNIYWSLPDRVSRYNTVTKQVQEISIPIGDVINLLIEKDGTIISQGDVSFSVSRNYGKSWSTQTGMDDSLYPGKFYAFAHDSSRGIIAIGHSDFFRSTDLGTTWQDQSKLQFSQLPPNFLSDHAMLTAPNGNIFVCDVDYNIMRSSDLGKTWNNNVSSGLPQGITSLSCDLSGILYTFSGQSIYRSTNNGDSWQFMINIIDPFLFNHIVTTSTVSSLVTTSKGEIFAGTTHDGIIMSSDKGMTWNVVNEYLD
jgi:photosystem II stability/assembly factor-like uncharacterized protein